MKFIKLQTIFFNELKNLIDSLIFKINTLQYYIDYKLLCLNNYNLVFYDAEVRKAKKFAIKAHKSVNHRYGKKKYSVHLRMVVFEVLKNYDCLEFNYKEIKLAIISAWLHDTIEDCRLTYNDIKDVFGESIADVVFRLSNEKGKTRSERANDKYYSEIKECKIATYVKICDRIANTKYSKRNGSSMYSKYTKERNHFINKLYRDDLKMVFDALLNV